MALFIEYSPAVQEVPGSIPGWDATFSDALCKVVAWLLTCLHLSTSGDLDVMCNSHAATCIRSDLHAYVTRNRIQPRCPIVTWGGAVATQVRSRMATKYGRSNGSFHRVPSKRVMSSPFLHKTIFFSESCLGDLMLYGAIKFDLKRA